MGRLVWVGLGLCLCIGRSWAAVQVTGAYLGILAPDRQPVACMVLENQGDSVVRLLGATTPDGQLAQLGEARWDDKAGRYRFRALHRLVVPAGGQAQLQPQGFWIWLADAKIRPGSEQALVLRFDDGSEVAVTLPVREVPIPVPGS